MDPFDIMLNPENVIPYYQPVLSADTQQVIGYEVLAYFQNSSDDVQNLGWFFKDSTIPDEFRLELKNVVLQKALDYYLNTDSSIELFFHYDALLLYKDNGEALLSLLQEYADRGLNLNKIIIQLKEEFPADQLDSVQKLFFYMKTMGLRIALNDFGERNGNLDRLAKIKPNLVKLDVGFLHDHELPHLYRDVHHSISLLSRKIGATLMFTGITSYNQLNYAWRNGGRYYQGSYLGRPQREFVAVDFCKEKIQTDFQHFVNFERKKIKAQLALTNEINQQFKTTLNTIKPEDTYDEMLLKIGNACANYGFRVFICNDEGLQLSSNAEKNKDGNWELLPKGRQKNWSWRPYFLENIARMNVEKKGILSDLYTDIEREEQIRTYSYPISETLYIFLDIPYAYLFEQEGLL
ncbi:EAL domain-containing protein [Caldibacillus lycopersici]|uniref:EAL domain-containing protein n=1 Tax=Perspicuibacillus lycopersici TaxID=1325689 RepID=A0AAE3IW06_9BACI|nr:EAL-associated domain-containing protein [Perspicuibacillus lycopersici]MCU9614421.1 EAL domain-containing protein [Perspicuibacillus lycopersici]